MLEVGNGGMKENEYRMHMSMWCLLAAPLLAGNDLTQMSPATLAILANPEAIAVDQDSAGVQARRVQQIGPTEVWVKPLADGSKAVGLFNREQGIIPVKVSLKDLGLGPEATARDLWEHKDLGSIKETLSVDVGEHAVVFLRLR
jgi:alpha-galactosidase